MEETCEPLQSQLWQTDWASDHEITPHKQKSFAEEKLWLVSVSAWNAPERAAFKRLVITQLIFLLRTQIRLLFNIMDIPLCRWWKEHFLISSVYLSVYPFCSCLYCLASHYSPWLSYELKRSGIIFVTVLYVLLITAAATVGCRPRKTLSFTVKEEANLVSM